MPTMTHSWSFNKAPAGTKAGRFRRGTVIAGVCVFIATSLVSCGSDSEAPKDTTAQSPSGSSTKVSTPSDSSEPTTSSKTTSTSASSTSSSSAPSDDKATPLSSKDEDSTKEPASEATFATKEVAEAARTYGSLAPNSLFEQFTECSHIKFDESTQCSGPEVGQFMFYANEAKAARTTQYLTELRSSRVVEDMGDFVVGWSTVGTTALITAIDNRKGLVLQHMMSSDDADPKETIFELGLAKAQQP